MSLAACGNKTDSRIHQKDRDQDAKRASYHSLEQLRRRREIRFIAGGDMTEENMTEDAGDIWDHGCG